MNSWRVPNGSGFLYEFLWHLHLWQTLFCYIYLWYFSSFPSELYNRDRRHQLNSSRIPGGIPRSNQPPSSSVWNYSNLAIIYLFFDKSRFAVRNSKKKRSFDWFAEQETSEGPEWFQTDCIWVQVITLTIQDQFYAIQNLQRSPILETSNWSGNFSCCFLHQTGSN